MLIREATGADLGEVMALYGEVSDAMVGTPADCRWRRGGHPSEEFVRGLIEGGGMLVAMEDGGLIAAIGVDHDLGHDYGAVKWLIDVGEELVAVIHLLVVREGWRGGGVARKLLRACLNRERARDMRTARLDATANNAPAIALYESEGFVQVGAGIVDVEIEGDRYVPFVVMERTL